MDGTACLQLQRERFSKLGLLLPSDELLLRVAEPRELLHERVYAWCLPVQRTRRQAAV